MDTSYENLRPSFSLDSPPFDETNNINSLCQTYLGDLPEFTFLPPATPHSTSSSFSSSSQYLSSPSLSPSPFTSYEENYCGSLLEEMEAYATMDVEEWRGEDSLDWAVSVCRRLGVDQNAVDLSGFRSTPGCQLIHFGVEEFSDLVGRVYGAMFHGELRKMCRRKEYGQNWRQGPGGSSPYSDSGSHFDLTSEYGGEFDLDLTSDDIRDLDRYILDKPSLPPLLDNLQLEEETMIDSATGGAAVYYDGFENFPESVAQISSSSSLSSSSSSSSSLYSSSSSSSSSSSFLLPPDPLKKIKQDPKKRPRGPKNWEFVIRLLCDSSTNPSLIRWENKEEGTFRLVQPAVIASMWGKRSDRPNLSYDNFARGLRYHYTTGALSPVSEKQLVYRCGPKAVKYLLELSKGVGGRH